MSKEIRKKIFFSSQVSQANKSYQFKLAWGSAPHPDKAWKGGEDALYVSKNILIIADGVGGWSKLGIDSGEYSRKLITIIKQILEKQKQKQLFYIERPQELAFRAVHSNEEKGSATLSVITVHPITGMVRSYHIGDSIFAIFNRNGQIFLAEEQQRSFNVPFQVYGGSKNIVKNQSDSDDEQMISDVYKGCYNQFSFNQIQDSTILLASDGLWDNLHVQFIQKELESNGEGGLVQKTKNIIKKVKQNYALSQFQSPFYHKALKQGETVPKCGKVDDISVILAEVIAV